jgi:hypothetical protein
VRRDDSFVIARSRREGIISGLGTGNRRGHIEWAAARLISA